jgi:hypothetical protein
MKPILIGLLAAAGALAADDRCTRELNDAARVASVMWMAMPAGTS